MKNKRVAIGVVLTVALCTSYNFWDSYHRTRSVGDGIASTVAAIISLALFLYLFKRRRAKAHDGTPR